MAHATRTCWLFAGLAMILFGCATCAAQGVARTDASPRIVNIVNFIRLLEPRDDAITEEVLYQTVVSQVEFMKTHRLPGTFLLQYDALMDDRYQSLLAGLPEDQFEVGAWWEIPQPLVERAGLRWRGRFPWDWHADVGFSSGYTPEEREKLVDAYMHDFRETFGRYPKSVASWFIDAHTLAYMHEKYGIIASANCKDQVGTDGYTLWGGYWNQAYYPSRLNAYMPAQTEAGQIPVPIFRMLGSDPLRQYDTGVGGAIQGVITLEPVYRDSGGDPKWVKWYFENFVSGECLAFNYTQAGQENSFTWAAMAKGLQQQLPLIANLRDEGKLRVETLGASGEWFRSRFSVTPATSLSFLSPLGDDTRQTVWYNSRRYRANLIWEDGLLRIRDIQLFNEEIASPILKHRVNGPAVHFYALPVVDGYHWSSKDLRAGLLIQVQRHEESKPLECKPLQVSQTKEGELRVECELETGLDAVALIFSEEGIRISVTGEASLDWQIQLVAADDADLPFRDISGDKVTASWQGHDYSVSAEGGVFESDGPAFQIRPSRNEVTLKFSPGG